MTCNFKNDYSVGAHPNVLNSLIKTSLVPKSGYMNDEYSIEAKKILMQKVENPNSATGGRIISALAKLLNEKRSGKGFISNCTARRKDMTMIFEKYTSKLKI
ncbi:hypothetical protein BAX95_17970 [Elizabethkingia meningoseptica]|uniref:hypothetical protein n=1 Tax=Elizabethkingia meningoseptica TaxID=238 RepID=UPI00099AD3B3|nr:hypothetical protein [Elizabethkingia meningoseptica]OPC21574.1 hypothetical protein BAX95_17970 [Elizabethkingia meningoseptica]